MDRKVEKIKRGLPEKPKLLNVAAYARVSSGKDAMLHSLSAQVSYYSEKIQSHPGWNYCGVYADEALTGTKEDRENFQRLITDCKAGKIDMVITKSISRFARNTLTLLGTVRELKSLGVDIYFEEQNIHSMSGDGELMLTILASYAQEESRSASENQKWRIRKSYERGEVLQWRYQFGFKITKDSVEIDPKAAQIVKEIFERAIAGESFGSICRDLNRREIRTARGNSWMPSRITEILTNEKYIGDSMMQKEYVNNHIEKKRMRNKGELPKYYAEGTHDAIIDKETFQRAQEVVKAVKKKQGISKPRKEYVFTSKIKCCNCGENFKRVTVRGKIYWNCRTFQDKGKEACPAKRIPDAILRRTAADVLGTNIFDERKFEDEIDHIEVPEANALTFIFRDGHTEKRIWEGHSRAESWTPEMKEKARQRSLEQWRKNKWQEQQDQ